MNTIFKNEKVTENLIVLLGFFSCISVFVSNVIILAVFILWVCRGEWQQKYNLIKSSKFSRAILLFLLFYIFGLCWGEFNIESWKWISKQSLLLMVPILISTQIRQKYIDLSISAFIVGMLINSFISIGCHLDVFCMNYHHYSDQKVAVGFIDHFDHSVFLGFIIIFLISHITLYSHSFIKRFFVGALIAIFIISLFLSHGRTGQYAFIILLALFLLMRYYSNIKNLIISFVSCAIIFTIIISGSEIFKERFLLTLQESSAFFDLLSYSSENTEDITVTDTAIGDRLTYIINYSKLIKEKPLFGSGTGLSIKNYNLLKDKVFPNVQARPPHNNYLFILAESGFVGLIFWLNIFVQLFIDIYINSSSQTRNIKLIFPIMFLLICFADEYLVRHTPTLFFCVFSSLLCVRQDHITHS